MIKGLYRVIVIGGGPAGLMAAGTAASRGASTLLIERMERPGRKLRITGKGRCNLTNTAPADEFIKQFGRKGRFLWQAFSRFSSDELIKFFESIGIPSVIERGGRVFPEKAGAGELTEALIRWVSVCGVDFKTSTRVTGITVDRGGVSRVEALSGASSRFFAADAVVVATGGVSYPATGSTGDGYSFAESTGHRVEPAHPALVPLVTRERWPCRLDGLTLRNISVKAVGEGGELGRGFGEVLFTSHGVSGPVPLALSRRIVQVVDGGGRVELCLDLKPALDRRKLDARLQREIKVFRSGSMKDVLETLLPSRMVPVMSELTGIPGHRHCGNVTAPERERLLWLLKDLRLTVVGHMGFNEAIVTAGGVNINDIDPYTMESRVVRGLFFAGEVMDMDAGTGGFNLQAAFSTGRLAGLSAAASVADLRPGI